MLNKLKTLNNNNLINLLFAAIPLSFIAGNLVLNLNTLLLIVTAIIIFKEKIFKFNYDLLDKLILIFFSYIFIVSLINYFINSSGDEQSMNLMILKKSFFYLRFLFLYLVIRYLVRENKISFKIFFFSASICSLFVCFDLIYQLINGFDVFGYEGVSRRLSGPFGDELIAGSYLQRFSLFSIFTIPVFYKMKDKKLLFIFLTLLTSVIVFSLVISGNRMPTILFLVIMFFILILEKSLRKFIIPFILIAFLITVAIFNLNTDYKSHLKQVNKKVSEFVVFFSNIITDKESEIIHSYVIDINGKQVQITNVYLKEFNAGFQTWLENKYIGQGVKSFKKNCQKANVKNCGAHPHNYYLEILADLGLVGFTLLFLIFIIIVYRSFIKKYFLDSSLKHNHVITPFIFLFLAEIFPVRTTGSFFTTGNASFFFLVMAIIIALSRKET
ncbi:MAG: O-antigen ligase family protein [Candidatus Pelagibacter sp.]